MTKRRIHHTDETADAIIAENAAHEGTPRTMSAQRAQESWEEFKERSNQAAEAVLEEVTQPDALKTKVNQTARRAKGFWRSYRTYLVAGAVALAAGVLYAKLKPKQKKSGWLGLLACGS